LATEQIEVAALGVVHYQTVTCVSMALLQAVRSNPMQLRGMKLLFELFWYSKVCPVLRQRADQIRRERRGNSKYFDIGFRPLLFSEKSFQPGLIASPLLEIVQIAIREMKYEHSG
jgi:hypothetical protein